jgi:hypothetical protein
MAEWRIEITTSGGFTGRGIGTMSASSAEASEDLAKSVEGADPTTWRPDYSPGEGRPDEVRYTIKMTLGDRIYVTSWRDSSRLPRNLAKLVMQFNL